MFDPLLYGKSQLERIVSIEPGDDLTELFIQQQDGNVRSEFVKNKYWILSNESHGSNWVRLHGELHYKWGKQFDNREDFLKARQYLKKHDIWSIFNSREAFLVKDGYTYYKGLKPKEVSILAFDIESTGLNHDETAKILCIANTFRDSNGKITRRLFSYTDHIDQKTMINNWCRWVRIMNPSMICGHNIYGFDLPYMNFIAEQEGTSLDLGRDESPIKFDSYESRFRKDGSQTIGYNKCHVYGREIVDTMFLAIKYDIGRKYESYGLKSIIKAEGLEVDNRVFYDASQIRFNYQDPVEWTKITKYAEFDGDDALALFDLMIPATFYWTQMVPKGFQQVIESATGSQINSMMVRSYLQNMHSIPKGDHNQEDFVGALSRGVPGIHSNVISFDVASLYPSIILEYEIYSKEKDPEANFLKIVRLLTNERLKNKKLAKETGDSYYKDLEQSQKVGINSAYGFMGASGLNFNYLEGASAITRYGREVLKTAIKWASNQDFETWEQENNV